MLPATQASPQATRHYFSLTVKPFAKIGDSTQLEGANLSSVNSPFPTITHASQIPHSSGATASAVSGTIRALHVNNTLGGTKISIENKNQNKFESEAPKKTCTDNMRFELSNVLEKRRLELSDIHEVLPNMIVSDKIMEQLSKIRPTTDENLFRIQGFDSNKVKLFGKDFIATIMKFCVEENIESDIFEDDEDSISVVFDTTKDNNANTANVNMKDNQNGNKKSTATTSVDGSHPQESSKRKLPGWMSVQNFSAKDERKGLEIKKIKTDSIMK